MRASLVLSACLCLTACSRTPEQPAPLGQTATATRPAKRLVPLDQAEPGLRAAIIATRQREAGPDFAIDAGGRARNPAHRLALAFDDRGVRLAGGTGVTAWSATVALAGVGCRGEVRPVAPGRAATVGNRREYHRPAAAGFLEWYLNGPLGLEFGYTLGRDPGCREAVFEIGVDGVALAPVGDRVLLRRAGAQVAEVREALALDARGRSLPARLAVAGGRLQVQVDVTGAVYPVAIDPLIVTEVLRVAPETNANSRFGGAVAIDGDTAVFGAPSAQHSTATPAQCCTTGAVCQTGAVWIYVRGAGGWALQARLERPLGEAFDHEYFGHAVDLSGDTVVVGAYQADGNVPNPGIPGTCLAGNGAAFVYTRTGTTWNQTAKLVASDGYRGDQFGYAVAIDGTTIVVGANVNDVGLTDNGAAYVFVYTGSSWIEQKQLTGTATGDNFGAAVAISGDTVVVGAPATGHSAPGSARVFVRGTGDWAQQGLLSPADGALGDEFGTAVAVSGYTAVVGARYHDHLGADAGAAYVFTRALTVWSEQQELLAADGAAGDNFGTSVALDGEKAVVGAPAAQVGTLVTELDPWTTVLAGTAASNMTTPAFTVGAGQNRLLVVAVLLEKASDTSGATITATYGGVPMTTITTAANYNLTTRLRNVAEHATLFFLRGRDLPTGPQPLSLTFSATVVGTNLHVLWASYQGVYQDVPYAGSTSTFNNAVPNSSGSPNVTFGVSVSYLAGGLTLYAAANAGAASSMTPPTGFTTKLTRSSDGHSSFAAATATHAAGGSFSGSTTVTIGNTSANSSAVVGMSLRPSLHHGAAYVFRRTDTTWIEETKLRAAALVSDAFLGTAVAFAPGYVVAGAPLEDEGTLNQPGAGYFFVQPGAPCVNPADCPGGNFCIDGVCCTSACDQPCESCKLPGTEGICTPVTGADDPDTCTGDYTCSAAGVCLRDRGVDCGGNGDCATGFCADQVCCDTACDGTCESCALGGSAGTCSPIPGGTDPAGECGTGACAGTCTGARACGNYPTSATTCGAASCSGATYDPADTCDGAGGCTATGSVLCADHLVCASPTACLTQCAQQADCVTNYWCNTTSHQCLAKKANGQACGDGFECLSTKCVDGVCCGTDCAGTCERCDVTSHLGTCWPVTDGADPDNECTGAGICGGVCNGTGACRFPGDTVPCAPPACAGSTLTLQDTCDGSGACADRGTQACPDNLVCDSGGTACLTQCAQQNDCVTNYWCETTAHQCLAKKSDGQTCGNGFECLSTRCVDGVCCGSDCAGTCERCDVAGHLGACWPVADGADPDDECTGTGTCGGVCDGNRACRFPDGGTSCAAASCSDGTRTPARTCDGAGACATVTGVWCDGFACQGDACGTTCTTTADCAPGYACDVANHLCKLAPGSVCGGDTDCASGVCAGGRCCTGACAHGDTTCGGSCDALGACAFPTTATTCGTCQVCDGQGACLGTPADDSTCPTVDCTSLSTTCATYGVITTNRCAAFGTCKAAPTDCAPSAFAASGTTCAASSCATGTETRHRCDGNGTCATSTVDCSPYVCGPSGACLLACAANGDCEAGLACHVASGSCRGADGDACSSGDQCASGFCVDGVCCGSACDGTCERCDLAATKGTCSPVASGDDPDEECTGTGTCGGTCDGSRACAYPDVTVSCGLCLACDSQGACGAMPDDDSACGAIACSALSTTCRTYADLTASRCATAGTCVLPTELTCTSYVDADDGTACTCDGGGDGTCAAGSCACSPPADAGAPEDAAPPEDAAAPPEDAAGPGPTDAAPAADAGASPGAAGGGCGCQTSGTAPSLVTLLLALGLLWRRRR